MPVQHQPNNPIKLAIVVAVAKNGVIGINNQLPWHLPKDFAHFKQLTLDNTVIMGRKTWQSLPKKPLPNRLNLILSRSQLDLSDYPSDEVKTIHHLQDIAQLKPSHHQAFIIGGAEIYQLTLPLCQTVYLTEVDSDPRGDSYFPTLNDQEWQLIETIEHPADAKHAYSFRFKTFQRSV